MRSSLSATVLQASVIALSIPLLMGVRCIPDPGGDHGGGSGGAAGSRAGGSGGSGGLGNRDGGGGGKAGGSAGAAAGAGGARPVDAGSDGPIVGTTCAPSPSTVWGGPQLGPPAIRTMWTIAPNDVLAYGGQLNRWDGTSWKVFSPQPPIQDLDGNGGTVMASSDNDIWVQPLRPGLVVERWNGASWLDVSPTFTAQARWQNLWLSGPNEAWVGAELVAGQAADGTEIDQAVVYHWTGSGWVPTPSPLDAMAGAVIGPMWDSAPNDVWLFVDSIDVLARRFIHWDGHAWRPAAAVAGSLTGIWGTAATNIWAVGSSNAGTAAMWHFDGTIWKEVDFGTSNRFSFVWGSCQADFWAALSPTPLSTGQLWHYDGTTWSLSDQPSGVMTGSSPDDIWLTGPTSDMLRHRRPAFCGDGRISPGEQCDPPHLGPDGLQCGVDCRQPTCGNGIIDPGEQCDPPKSLGSTSLCTQACQIPTCGNGVVDPGETCEPPQTNVCDAQCQTIPIACGNGILQPGETCELSDNYYCKNCRWTSPCGQCASDLCHLGKACSGLTGADQANCTALESCLIVYGRGICYYPGNIGWCFCANPDCKTGLSSTAQCLPQLQAMARTTDPATLLELLKDPTNIYGALGTEVSCPYSSGCGFTCSQAVSSP
jgi:hypothetical protein